MVLESVLLFLYKAILYTDAKAVQIVTQAVGSTPSPTRTPFSSQKRCWTSGTGRSTLHHNLRRNATLDTFATDSAYGMTCNSTPVSQVLIGCLKRTTGNLPTNLERSTLHASSSPVSVFLATQRYQMFLVWRILKASHIIRLAGPRKRPALKARE